MNEEQKREFLRNLIEMRKDMSDTKKKQELKKMVEETFKGQSGTDRNYNKICQLFKIKKCVKIGTTDVMLTTFFIAPICCP